VLTGMVGRLREEPFPGSRGTITGGGPGQTAQEAGAETPPVRAADRLTGSIASPLRNPHGRPTLTGSPLPPRQFSTSLGIPYQSAYYFPSLLSDTDYSIFPPQGCLDSSVPAARHLQ
jgi:hypothetical protein